MNVHTISVSGDQDAQYHVYTESQWNVMSMSAVKNSVTYIACYMKTRMRSIMQRYVTGYWRMSCVNVLIMMYGQPESDNPF
jgi:hypothetical protein